MADRSTEYREIPGLNGVGVVRHAGPMPPVARHTHQSVCATAIMSGVRILETAQGRWEAGAGQILAVPSDLPHRCQDAGTIEYAVVSMAPECFATAGLVPGLQPDRPEVVDDPVRFGDLLRLAELADRPASNLERQAALLAVMEPLCRSNAASTGTVEPAESERIATVRRHLESACADDVSLEELAAMAECSPCRLNRLFARAVGMPPHEYQILQRIRLVKTCIRNGLSLAQSAADAGFSDQSHMTRCFRRVMGMTPGVFAAGVRAPKNG
ncbi:AraC family transcriptional regulator [uncultured Pseudodesulfovibrio sp.]|uniref:helix-turn-helix domain-containing protein n=1 Tax=uncultured Pseudodesulfovibrio sp. TaxID=2035858 RepID=UPI0029C6E498|nr:AraC family transcriptional regulator [uncultured Pseudodesulfovibrio sp.]